MIKSTVMLGDLRCCVNSAIKRSVPVGTRTIFAMDLPVLPPHHADNSLVKPGDECRGPSIHVGLSKLANLHETNLENLPARVCLGALLLAMM